VPALMASISEATTRLNVENFLAPSSNADCDVLTEIVEFRNGLMRLQSSARKRSRSKPGDPALVISV
ncbi:hypothetical protein, partial [Stenotrophomonas sp. A3_2]|uniref:hypothetical protein n=1 Tax=Stenotrophomonas sp. A3_2 TaxID=3119978 RepID=UPI002FC27520